MAEASGERPPEERAAEGAAGRTSARPLSTLDKIKRFFFSKEEWEAYLVERLELERQKQGITRYRSIYRPSTIDLCSPIIPQSGRRPKREPGRRPTRSPTRLSARSLVSLSLVPFPQSIAD